MARLHGMGCLLLSQDKWGLPSIETPLTPDPATQIKLDKRQLGRIEASGNSDFVNLARIHAFFLWSA